MGLNAESNRPVEGLQLRLEGKSIFSWNFDNNKRMIDRKYLSESRQGPIPKTGPVKSQKPE